MKTATVLVRTAASVMFLVFTSGFSAAATLPTGTPSSGSSVNKLPAPFANAPYLAIPGSLSPTTDADTGEFRRAQMSVEVVLAPSYQSQMSSLLANLYNPSSPGYQRWLQPGQFNSTFAPSNAQIAAVAGYLRATGLTVEKSSSPFLVRAIGSSNAVSAAFKTSLHIYRNHRGIIYFSNASVVQLPKSFAAGVLGVLGLSNTVRARPNIVLPPNRNPAVQEPHGPLAQNGSTPNSSNQSCQGRYPTREQLFALLNDGTQYVSGYGAGPGCSGLTPSQDNSIYGAPNVGRRGQGAGVNLAVYELSAYRRSDIATWAHHYYGPAYNAPLVDLTVDGGPLQPVCPLGDPCPPEINGFNGDVEVDADIETQLAISPAVKHLLVYNAPNDTTGQTLLDEYVQIASDDTADVISSSWGFGCENDTGAPYAQAENVIFEQMALQGQSMFVASGDTGAFGCIRSTSGTTVTNVDDPAEPWVTTVGGTSFESFNPLNDPDPHYAAGVETVWNVDNLCNISSNEGGFPGFFWCAAAGAGTGGNSQFWGRPFFQFGPNVTNRYSTFSNGTVANCYLAARGTPCREVPDISADADEFTGYSEYCTGNPNPPDFSTCGTIFATPPGWFEIGGTSLSSPLWSGIFADRDSFQGGRSGNANPLLYNLYRLNPHGYFNDISGIGQSTNNNGLFPTTPGYDLATGIGTPKMSAIITGFAR